VVSALQKFLFFQVAAIAIYSVKEAGRTLTCSVYSHHIHYNFFVSQNGAYEMRRRAVDEAYSRESLDYLRCVDDLPDVGVQ